MMGLVHVILAVLSLLTVGQSAPVTSCESLTKQVEIIGRNQLLGKWMYIGESTTIAGFKLLTKALVETSWARISAADESDAINVFQSQKMLGRCFTATTKMTLGNNTLSMVHPMHVSEVLLSTGCPDCLVLQTNFTFGGSTYKGLQFMRFCPDESNLQETETTDLTTDISSMNAEDVKLFDRFLSSSDGIQLLIKIITTGLTGLKEN
ncbi:uncharacterized protein LOC128368993 isoform X2 [Scomber japonicus]|uniref:uncharacterized protein LOC128368993 isoform X2 n=1 Tax=Scomber japonicus TaxID=13676 RepID=UPI002304D82B|nr:uncharacterized protein LOC128368993 isoform X2 [Scomber japonicus]